MKKSRCSEEQIVRILQDVARGDRTVEAVCREHGPAVEDVSMPHAGESFEGKTGTEDVSGR